MNRYAASVRKNVLLQGAYTGFLLLLPTYEPGSNWWTVSVVTTVGCIALGLYLHLGGPSSYEVIILWEAGVVIVDGYALSRHVYLAGGLWAVVTLIGLLNTHARPAFYAPPATPKQTRQPTVPAQWSPPAGLPVPVPYGAGSIPPPPPAGWRPPPPAWPPAQR